MVLSTVSASATAEQIIAREQRGSLSVKVVELQAPAPPVHGVSMQAAHELSVSASQNGVRIDGLEILQGSNLRSGSAGDAVRGYIYLDAMPEKTLKTLALADDSSRTFAWSYRIRYSQNGQSGTFDGRVISSSPVRSSAASERPAIDVGGLLDGSAPPPPTSNNAPSGAGTAVAGLDVDALFGAPQTTPPSSPPSVTRSAGTTTTPRLDSVEAALGAGQSPADSIAVTGTIAGSRVDESLGDALALRDQERERKAYVARALSLRDGLVEQQSIRNSLLAEVSKEHQQIDQRRAEAERRRRAEAESSSNGRLLAGFAVGTILGVAGHRAGLQNAGEMAGRLGANIARGNAGSGFAEYSASMNQGMNQRLAELERQNRQTLNSRPSQLTDGQRMYRESVQRSETGRQQLIAQGKLRDSPRPPTVTAALNNSSGTSASYNSGSRTNLRDYNNALTDNAGSNPATLMSNATANVQREEFRPDCQVRSKLTHFEGEVRTRNTMVHSITYITQACLAAKKNFIEAYACNIAERMDSARAQCSSACGDPTCRGIR